MSRLFPDQLELTALRAEALHAAEFNDFNEHVFGEPDFGERLVAHAGHVAAERLQIKLNALQVRLGGAAEFFFFVFYFVRAHRVLTFDGRQ